MKNKKNNTNARVQNLPPVTEYPITVNEAAASVLYLENLTYVYTQRVRVSIPTVGVYQRPLTDSYHARLNEI